MNLLRVVKRSGITDDSAKKHKSLKASKEKNFKKYTRSKFGNFIFVFFLVALGLFSVLPLIYSIITSFKPLEELLVFPPPFYVVRPTLQNYRALPNLLSNLSIPLSRYIFNSLFVTISATVLYVFIATMAAFALAKSKIKGKAAFFVIVQFALLFNGTTLSVPLYLIYSWLGIVDTYWVMIIPYAATSMGVFLMKQYMESAIPDALLEAGEIDGAGPIRIFFQIAVPIVKPCLLTLMMFGFRDVWAAIPDGTVFNESLKTLPTIMSQITAGGIARSGSAMAVTVIMMIPPILVYVISQSNVMEAMSSAGIKE
ncbi:MAG: carbohydrate ABC transporter permease [Clostridia bacterium]|nr:carbohydrate ABC transporter permease [Clostridia bacterium]